MQRQPAVKRLIVEDDLSERGIESPKNTAEPWLVRRLFGHGLIEF